MEKNCKTCKHGISMDKVCKNCKHGNWGAEFPKVCLSCKEGEFWEPKEAMDIWKEAPEGAEYYDNEAGLFYRLIGNEVQFYYGIAGVWIKSERTQSALNGGLKRNAVIKRPQAEQEEPKEWNDGLPPAGEKCLLNVSKAIAYEVVLEWASDKNVVFRHCDDDAEQFAAKDWFKANVRPIKSQAEKEREEFKARLKQWVDANVWDGEDRKGCKGDSASFDPDDLQELFDDAVDFIIESGMAKRLADKADS